MPMNLAAIVIAVAAILLEFMMIQFLNHLNSGPPLVFMNFYANSSIVNVGGHQVVYANVAGGIPPYNYDFTVWNSTGMVSNYSYTTENSIGAFSFIQEGSWETGEFTVNLSVEDSGKNPDIGNWHQTTSYPIGIGYMQALTYGNYVYVLGGSATNLTYLSNNVYYSQFLLNGNLSVWTQAINMPSNAVGQNGCTAYDGKIYCIGLNNDSSYFSQILQNGSLGEWSRTTPYPINMSGGEQCFNQSDLFCCVGGTTNTGLVISDTYCSYLEDSGISAWTKSTSYPIPISKQRMSVYDGYVYSVGGSAGGSINVDESYYAKINSDGIGDWTKTTSYPLLIRSFGLTTYNEHIYGVGGLVCGRCFAEYRVFYAPISSNGIGAWSMSENPYQNAVFHQACVQKNGKFYCIGGEENSSYAYPDVYYADLNAEPQNISDSLTYNASGT
jgi:hypothetical protein